MRLTFNSNIELKKYDENVAAEGLPKPELPVIDGVEVESVIQAVQEVCLSCWYPKQDLFWMNEWMNEWIYYLKLRAFLFLMIIMVHDCICMPIHNCT